MKSEKQLIGGSFSRKASDNLEALMYIEGYASTNDVDRANDVIEPSAWIGSMANYMKFPVILLNHNWDTPPVGKVVDYKIDDKGLWVKVAIAPTIQGREVATLIEFGLLKAFSVGFNVKRYERSSDDDAPMIILEAELIEISVVNVPCNMSALFDEAKAKGITVKHLISKEGRNGNNVDEDKVKAIVDPAIKEVKDDVGAQVKDVEGKIGALTKITNELKDAAQNGTKSSGELRDMIDRMEKDTKAAIDDLTKEVAKAREKNRPPSPFYGNPATVSLKSLIDKDNATLKAMYSQKPDVITAVKELQRLNDSILFTDALMAASSEKESGDYHRMPRTQRIKSLKQFKEITEFAKAMDIATSTEGSELIPTELSGQIEDMVRMDLTIAPLFRQIPMPQSPFKLPVHTGDTEATLLAEKTAVISAFDSTEQTPTSTAVTFTASKARSRIQVSAEITEDAAIAIMPYVFENASRGIACAVDEAIVNGDNGTTHFDTGYTVGSTDFRRAWDGLRYHFQTTLSAHGIDASTFNEAKLKHIRSEMGKYGVKPSQLAYLCGVKTYLKKILGLDNLQTLDKYGPNAVVLTGEALKVDGVPVVVSEYVMENLNASGIYDASTTDRSEVLVVNRNAWGLGHYRPISVDSEKDIINDVYQIVAFKRCSFMPLYTPTATTGVVVNSAYNVTF